MHHDGIRDATRVSRCRRVRALLGNIFEVRDITRVVLSVLGAKEFVRVSHVDDFTGKTSETYRWTSDRHPE